jgi:hypothetical protein
LAGEGRGLALGRPFQLGQPLLQFGDPLLQLLNERVPLPQLTFQLGQARIAGIRRCWQIVSAVGHLGYCSSFAAAWLLSNACSFPAV